ncbi:MAG: hypothetical protein GF388_07970 [Candidatus Aegiribacteria sp.]|nr:hypothetical protein [Candidatus Aegiribacteria sp.]MBD3295042.1 hypothetical protein [Candidatus Fermentibacteria bacterium]
MPNPWHTLVNPMDYFDAGELDYYDHVDFKAVWAEQHWLSDPTNSGVFFLPDGAETKEEVENILDEDQVSLFQDVIHSAVDIVVSPYSEMSEHPDNDGCGVYSVGYEILYQNPQTLVYETTESSRGSFGYRQLFSAFGQIEEPSVWMDKYNALFHDPNQGMLFQNPYIVTNCGAIDTASWENGWDNVWTDESSDDWEKGICRGAWNTFLAVPGIGRDPENNSEAYFSDGRYSVLVTAESHGSRLTGGTELPVDDLDAVSPEVRGIVVDNFMPSVRGVEVYLSGETESGQTRSTAYTAAWVDSSCAGSERHEQLEYLEELRRDLRYFESLEEPERRDDLQLPPNLRLFDDAPDVANNLPDGEEPGLCLPEGAGMEPVEFLREEIARVENELDGPGGKLNLVEEVEGYISENPASDASSLNLIIYYSEPTMVEDAGGNEIVDYIWLSGHIGEGEYWDSRDHGQFLRSGEYGALNSTSAGQGEGPGSGLLEDVNRSNAVHYMYTGSVPSEFEGMIRVHIGSDMLGGDQGPRDTAGHMMDGTPESIPGTRMNYESWASGYNWPRNYDPGEDCNYQWGVPDWELVTDDKLVYGRVVWDTVAVVDLAEIGMDSLSWFMGDCDYWCGFWLFRAFPGAVSFDIPVIEPDGAIRNYGWSTGYPIYGGSSGPGVPEPFWTTYPYNHKISDDTDCYWMTGDVYNLPEGFSYSTYYCQDAENGISSSDVICRGVCFAYFDESPSAGAGKYTIAGCYSNIVKVYRNNSALIGFAYHTFPSPDSVVYDYVVLKPPQFDGGQAIRSEDPSEENSLEPSETLQSVAEVLSNPVRENLSVMVSGERGASWRLDLYDISGRCVASESGVMESSGFVEEFDLQSLPSGVYVLRSRVGGVEDVRSVSVVR